MDARGLVLDFLHTLQAQGVSRLPVDESARGILREWMLAAKRGLTAPRRPQVPVELPPPSAVPMPAPQAPAAASAPAPQEPPAENDIVSELREGIPDLTQENTEEEWEVFFRPGGATPEEQWAQAERMLPRWEPLRQLGTLRPTMVFGTGCRTADIMFVGDAPGYQDEKETAPFRGEAGGKLDGMLKAMGLTREAVYLTHLVKFRPAQPRQTINTRPPNEKEIKTSLPVLDWEVNTVRPRVIVALGVIAARAMLGGGQLPLAEYQERGGVYRGVPVEVTHHPSYLLRTSDLTERRRLWEEMLRVMEMAGLPISDKQRGFFLPKR